MNNLNSISINTSQKSNKRSLNNLNRLNFQYIPFNKNQDLKKTFDELYSGLINGVYMDLLTKICNKFNIPHNVLVKIIFIMRDIRADYLFDPRPTTAKIRCIKLFNIMLKYSNPNIQLNNSNNNISTISESSELVLEKDKGYVIDLSKISKSNQNLLEFIFPSSLITDNKIVMYITNINKQTGEIKFLLHKIDPDAEVGIAYGDYYTTMNKLSHISNAMVYNENYDYVEGYQKSKPPK